MTPDTVQELLTRWERRRRRLKAKMQRLDSLAEEHNIFDHGGYMLAEEQYRHLTRDLQDLRRALRAETPKSLPNHYETAGPEADEAAEVVAELFAGDVGPLARMLLQPNPRLYLAAYLEELADDVGAASDTMAANPEEAVKLRRAAAVYREQGTP